MKILITNDDGYQAIGIKKLVEFSLKYGEVMVVAPKYEQSGKSQSITLRKNYSCERVEDIIPGVKTWSVDSTPTDCLRVAKYFLHLDYDIVFSGVNNGYNIGDDIAYSGTVSATNEAAYQGKKTIAFSTGVNDLNKLDKELEYTLNYVFENKLLDKWGFYNINIPVSSTKVRFVKQGRISYNPEYVEDENGLVYPKPIIWWQTLDNDNTDVDYVYNKYITITPLVVNRTNFEILSDLKKLEK